MCIEVKKMKLLLLQVFLVLLPMVGSPPVLANEVNDSIQFQYKAWNKTPIDFIIPVKKQRILAFEEKVSLAEKNEALTTDEVSIINNDGMLYITALKTFKPVMMPLRLVKSGQVILVYLSATDSSQDNTPVKIITPKAADAKDSANMSSATTTVNAVTVTRFAIQQFSNQRLATKPNNIARTPLLTQKQVNFYYGSSVTAYPLISWQSGVLYVSVVQLKNNLTQAVTLDPRNLIGDWQSAAFYPSNLIMPRGAEQDNTLVFVVSDKPFGQALRAINPFARRGSL